MKIKISKRATHARNALMLLQNISARVWQNLVAFSSVVNPLGPRILLKHAPLFPGFLANFERFLPRVQKSVEKKLFNIDKYKLCLF